MEPYESQFRYVGNTVVLESEHRTSGGMVRVRDAFVIGDRGAGGLLVRACEGLAGEVEVESLLDARFDDGREPARLEPAGDALVATGGQLPLLYATAVTDVDRTTRFRLRQGERAAFALAWG